MRRNKTYFAHCLVFRMQADHNRLEFLFYPRQSHQLETIQTKNIKTRKYTSLEGDHTMRKKKGPSNRSFNSAPHRFIPAKCLPIPIGNRLEASFQKFDSKTRDEKKSNLPLGVLKITVGDMGP